MASPSCTQGFQYLAHPVAKWALFCNHVVTIPSSAKPSSVLGLEEVVGDSSPLAFM